jgi:hypothetical protein
MSDASAEMKDDSYVLRQGQKNESLPVQRDGDAVENPIDENTADSDEQLGRYFVPRFFPYNLLIFR